MASWTRKAARAAETSILVSDAERDRIKQGLRVMRMIGQHRDMCDADLATMLRQLVSQQDGVAAHALASQL